MTSIGNPTQGPQVQTPAATFKCEAGKTIRSVGVLEWFMYTRAKLQADSCVIVSARYTNPSGTTLDKATLFPALNKVVRSTVALHSRVATPTRTRDPPEWVLLPSFDLERVVEFVDSSIDNLESVFESQFTRGFDVGADLPLWRLAVLRDGTVIFAFDHAMCDGQSGIAFLRMLLTALRQTDTQASSRIPTIVEPPQNSNLPPPLEECIDIPIPFGKILRELLKLANPFAWRRRFSTWTGNPIPRSFELDMAVHIQHYTPSDTTHLVRLSRAHSATLTSTLHTVALLALSRTLHAHSTTQKYKYTTTYVPISLRRYSGASANDLCNHYSFYYSSHPFFPASASASTSPDPREFPWDAATQFATTLKREVPRSVAAVGLMRLAGARGKHESVVRGALGGKRAIAIELSNVGWDIREAIFAQGDGTLGAALKVNVTGTPAGGLGIAITWGKSGVDDAFGREFVAAFASGVQGLLHSPLN